MPTYAYACTACGHRFDVQQSFSDAALTQCPECQGKLRKLFNTVGIVFKGSGFYRTDSRTPAAGTSSTEGGSKPTEAAPSPSSSPSSSGGSGESTPSSTSAKSSAPAA